MVDKIFTDYKTLPEMLNAFIASNAGQGQDVARIVYLSSVQEYVDSLSAAGILRMPFYVFNSEQVQAITEIVNAKVANLAVIDPFAEILFQTQNSKYDIDQYFNLWFAPLSGMFNTQAAVDAYMLVGEYFEIPFNDINELAQAVKTLSVNEYASFMAGVVTGIKSLNPQGYIDGINRFTDYQDNILFNLENFQSSNNAIDRAIANRQIIFNALALPKDNIVFQTEYLKNLDLSLFTRLLQNGLQELPPNNPRLDYVSAILIWRHNARVKLGDISGEILIYQLVPEKDSWQTKLGTGVAAFVAVALIAPYVVSTVVPAIKTAAAKVATWAGAKTGEVAVTAATKSMEQALADIKNSELEIEKFKLEEEQKETQRQANISTSDTNYLAPIAAVGAAILLTKG